jgi:hypothetical protein
MRARRFVQNMVFGALVLGAALTAGCKSYHYYDIDIQFEQPGFMISDAGMLQLCALTVSGADSGSFVFPDNDTTKGAPICPVQKNFPDLGTFEYATFEDSGTLHFVVSGYDMMSALSENCFAAGSTDIGATDAITTPGKITLSMTTSGCAQ